MSDNAGSQETVPTGDAAAANGRCAAAAGIHPNRGSRQGALNGNGWEHTYLCIDLKSFYASVECADRDLDPFETDLVVADPTRSANTICLAITPALKAKGVRNRCRVRDIPASIDYTTAMPRMHRYMEVSTQIYAIYLRYVSTEDAWPYSVDECFLDVTGYLHLYGTDAKGLAKRMIADVRRETGIAATAGIGPNLFLAKLALDVMAKHADDGIGMLDRASFMRQMWFHHPITDVWGIGPGIARRLARRGVFDLAGICALGPVAMHREFGKNGDWLLDHAWGLEPCTIAQARGYVPRQRSLSNGQVLMRDYGFGEARTVLREMIWESCLNLTEHRLACTGVGVWVGYSGWDGRPGAGGQHHLPQPTASQRDIEGALLALYDARVARDAKIRRIGLWLGGVVPADAVQPTLFDVLGGGDAGAGNRAAATRTIESDAGAGSNAGPVGADAHRRADSNQQALFDAVAAAKRRFGPNAVLRGTSLMPGANARERNLQIGGHRA